jgi:hypothetical protein
MKRNKTVVKISQTGITQAGYLIELAVYEKWRIIAPIRLRLRSSLFLMFGETIECTVHSACHTEHITHNPLFSEQ